MWPRGKGCVITGPWAGAGSKLHSYPSRSFPLPGAPYQLICCVSKQMTPLSLGAEEAETPGPSLHPLSPQLQSLLCSQLGARPPGAPRGHSPYALTCRMETMTQALGELTTSPYLSTMLLTASTMTMNSVKNAHFF